MRFFCARKTTCAPIMAGRDGGAFALAGSYCASLSTLSRPATPFDSALARLRKLTVGAANMATSACPFSRGRSTPLFIWRFYSCQDSTYITTTAASEQEARLQLPAVRLVFAARIRQEGIHHA
ncbi:host cell division inhibitor Icd-like protein [Salmonella enterica subsp. enterica serovar Derby]|nr:host cell division inhibitor Icd-like protein [Salmonella enterica subsp. enterica serovar Derby]